MNKTQKFPEGWDEARVRDVLAHYEGQTEDEQAAEIETAMDTDQPPRDDTSPRRGGR